MKASGSGILLIAALAVVAAAVAAWQWSAGEAPRPGQTTEPGAADRQTPGADAKPTAGGTAIAPERSEVPTPPAAAPDEPAAEPADADAAAGKFAVRGRVVDVRGNGIADAHVHVTDQPVADLPFGIHGIEGLDDMLSGRPGDASTAADGTFELRVPDAGPFRLVATHPDHPRGDYRGEATADVEGVVITLRDGARITGSVLGAPPEAESIVVFARRLKGTVEKATSGALLDVSGLVEAVGAPLGAARAEVDAERRFELRGLDPDSRYSIWAANATTANGMPLKSTPALEFAAGTLGAAGASRCVSPCAPSTPRPAPRSSSSASLPASSRRSRCSA